MLMYPVEDKLGLFPRKGLGDNFTGLTKYNLYLSVRLFFLHGRYLKFQFHRQKICPFCTPLCLSAESIGSIHP